MTSVDERSMGRLKMLIWLAVAGVVVAAAAGLILLVAAPEAGSGAKATLGLSAAVGRLAAAAFSIAAAIYAQVRIFGVLLRCQLGWPSGYLLRWGSVSLCGA